MGPNEGLRTSPFDPQNKMTRADTLSAPRWLHSQKLEWFPALTKVVPLFRGSTTRFRFNVIDVVEVGFQIVVSEFLKERVGEEFHADMAIISVPLQRY